MIKGELLWKCGKEFYCSRCSDLLFILTRDVFIGELTHESMLTGGQNFKQLDKMVCKKCGECFEI